MKLNGSLGGAPRLHKVVQSGIKRRSSKRGSIRRPEEEETADLCQLLAQGFGADVERLPDLRSVVGLVRTISYQELDFILAYVMALFCFVLLLF